MDGTEAEDTFRYSPITLATYAVVLCAAMIAFIWALIICAMQLFKVPNAQNFALFLVYLSLPIIWGWLGIKWLRDRPTLKVCASGISIARYGTKPFLVRWDSIEAVEEIIARLPQTGRITRNYRVRYREGEFRFNTYYTGLERLLHLFNEQVDRFGIKVLRVSEGKTVVEKHLEIVPRGRQGFAR